MSDTTPLDDAAFMRALLDAIIPPGGGGRMPGAGSLGLGDEVAPRIAADPMLGPAVGAGIAAVRDAALARDPGGFAALPPDARAEVIESVLAAHPMLITGLALHVYPAYYQHPRVLEGLHEPPRTPFPEGYPLEDTDPALLSALESRRRRA